MEKGDKKPSGPDPKLIEAKMSLPIRSYADQIMNILQTSQVVIVVGHTGCGKSTQLPQILYENGYGNRGVIACTQPRRFAAISLATRVAKEMGRNLGTLVGFKVRFWDRCGKQTRVKYLTDGSLVRQCLTSSDLRGYSAVILDEVHERSLQTDILFGLVKRALRQRPDFRLILTSATVQADSFSRYFFDAPIIEVPGRLFDVEIVWDPYWDGESGTDPNVRGIAGVVQRIHRQDEEGDILVFLTGKPEIERVGRELAKEPRLVVVPAHGELQTSELDRIHEVAPPGERKVVLATNLAETSLTVDGVVFVVDHGFMKIKRYNGEQDLDQLVTVRCSRAQAEQRRGRAGRTRPGKCYRLYSERLFEKEMLASPEPEVSRVNLAGVTLQLKHMRYEHLLDFDFIDRPNIKNVKAALDHLHQLEALDDECCLTRKGHLMASYPLEPKLSASLISASGEGCAEDVLLISAMLSEYSGSDLKKLSSLLAPNKRIREDPGTPCGEDLMHPLGETMAIRNILHQYIAHKQPRIWCYNFGLDSGKLFKAKQIYDQLKSIMQRQQLSVTFRDDRYGEASVVRSLLDAGFANLAHFCRDKVYALAKDSSQVRVDGSLLKEGDMEPVLVFAMDRFQPPKSRTPFLGCITRVPDDVSIKPFTDRFQVRCSHFQAGAERPEQPHWMVDATEWRERFVRAEEARKEQELKTNDWQERYIRLESRLNHVEIQKNSAETRLHNMEPQINNLQSALNNVEIQKRHIEARLRDVTVQKRNIQSAYETLLAERNETQTKENRRYQKKKGNGDRGKDCVIQ